MASPDSARRLQLALLGLCLFLFLFGLGARDLWDVDEGMHSVAAKHVVESGDWVTPMYNGEPFFDKPMFFTWLVAISFLFLGFTEFAARLPAALIGLAGVWVTYRLGRQMFQHRTGLLAGAILATSLLFLVMSRTVVHDAALALFTTLALALFYEAVQNPERRRLCMWLFYVAVAGAVLAKGPLGALLPALVIGPYLLLTRRLGLIRELRLGWGIVILLVLSAPWYILMDLRNEGYLAYFLIDKNFGSFASGESTHPAPVHFYVPVLLGALLPWTVFLPAALYRAARRLSTDERDPILYLLLWAGAMFVFFSAATSKLASYLLPMMPALALLIALPWDEALARPRGSTSRILSWSQLPVVLLAAAGFVYGFSEPPVGLEVKYGISLAQVLALGLGMAILPTVAWFFLLRRRPRAAFGSLVATVGTVLALFVLWVGPSMNPYRSTRELALEYDRMLPPMEPMTFFWREKDSALFYTDRDGVVLPTWEVESFLDSEQEVLFVADVRHLDRLAEFRDRFAYVYRKGSKVVISNRLEAEVAAAVPEGQAR